MAFIGLQVGESKHATVKTPSPREGQNSYGKTSYAFDFIINGEDHTLEVSKSSGAYKAMQSFKSGDRVIIIKKDIGNNRSTYDVIPGNNEQRSIEHQDQNLDLTKESTPHEDWKKDKEDFDLKRRKEICWGQAANAASRIIATRTGSSDNTKVASEVYELTKELMLKLYPDLISDKEVTEMPYPF